MLLKICPIDKMPAFVHVRAWHQIITWTNDDRVKCKRLIISRHWTHIVSTLWITGIVMKHQVVRAQQTSFYDSERMTCLGAKEIYWLLLFFHISYFTTNSNTDSFIQRYNKHADILIIIWMGRAIWWPLQGQPYYHPLRLLKKQVEFYNI